MTSSAPLEADPTGVVPVIDLGAAELVRANAVARWAAYDTPAVIRARQRWLADAYGYRTPSEPEVT